MADGDRRLIEIAADPAADRVMRPAAAIGLIWAAAAIAGCSSSAPSTSSPPAPTSATAPGGIAGPGPSAQAAIVWVHAQVAGRTELILLADTSQLGSRPLYYNVDDTSAKASCTGSCTKVWIPLLSGELIDTTARSAVTGISFVPGVNGKQAVYKGHPLYMYVRDAHGLGPYGNGTDGIWYVVTPAVKATT